MMFIRLIIYQLMALLTFRNLLINLIVYATNVWLVYIVYADVMPSRILDATAFIFYLPINPTFDMLRWLLVLLPLLLVVGSFTEQQLKKSSSYLLIQMKSYHMWWHSFALATIGLIITFITSGYVISMLLVNYISINLKSHLSEQPILTFLTSTEAGGYLLRQFCLLILSTIILVLIMIFISFLTSHSGLSFTGAIISLALTMILSSIGPRVGQFFPVSYAFLGFENNHSYLESIIIMLFTIVILYIFCWKTFEKRKEFLFELT